MELLAITREEFFGGEAEAVCRLLDGGFARVHLRKPTASREALRALIERIPLPYRDRLSLHDHHGLAAECGVGGVHLNGRNPEPPAGFGGRVSRSCHALGELRRYPAADYLFLSPIYDSLSKRGYRAAFTPEELLEASTDGTIGRRTVALGGVTPERLPHLAALGFGGAAMLGFIWGDGTPESVERNLKIIQCCNS